MKLRTALKLMSFFAGLCIYALNAEATVLQLPPVNVLTTTTYNNFQIQSLDLDQKCSAALDPRCLPSGPYPVQSSPGQISDQAIILTGANGNPLNNMPSPFPNGSAVDNPFLTPTGSQSNSFVMNGTNEPSNTFTGDQAGSWEINIGLLNNYLNGNQLVFLFDNNQQGTGANQALSIWGQVNIINSLGVSQGCVQFSTGTTGCNGNAPANNYVPAIGNYCVSFVDGSAYAIGTAANQGSCSAHVGDYFVNDNLSTSNAEYAVFSSFLNAANLQTWASEGFLLSVDMRYLGNNAGAEQLWICSQCNVEPSNQTPEPGTLALMGIAVFALAIIRRRSSGR